MPVPRTLQGLRGAIRLSVDPPRKGGQAEVYRGTDAEGRPVAVKVALDGEEERRGLLAEREALKAIQRRQPGCERWMVPIHDEGTTPDGRPFLVLPWFEHSLQSWLRVEQPPLRRRLDALILAAEAVVQLHRSAASLSGVVLHRDLKPGNLLVEDSRDRLRVVLADLGGVKERKLHDATRNTGIHTPYFAPLEQMLPVERPPDPSVDVHALAVVIYVVLAGRPPQAVMSRTGLLTSAAEELVELHRSGEGKTEAEKARYQELRRVSLDVLVELDHAVALPDDDVNRLRQALVALQSEQGERADEIAAELTRVLVPPLRHALEPNPKSRLSRPEVLLAALEAAADRLGVRSAAVAVEEVKTRSLAAGGKESEAAGSVPGRPSQRGRWRGVATFGLAALLLATCAGLVAVPVLNSGTDDDTPVEPTPPPPSPEPVPEVVATPAPATRLDPSPAPDENRKEERGVASKPQSQAPSTGPSSQPGPVTAPQPPAGPGPPSPSSSPPPAAKPPASELKILVDDDSTPVIRVDGRQRPPGSVKLSLDTLAPGSYPVAIQSRRASEPRTFQLVLSVDASNRWMLWLRDGTVQVGSVEVTQDATIRIRWTQEGSITLEK